MIDTRFTKLEKIKSRRREIYAVEDRAIGFCLSCRSSDLSLETSLVFLLFLGLKSQRREIRSHSLPGVVSSLSLTNSASATRLFFLCFSTCSACLAYHSSSSLLAVLRHSSSFASSFLSFSAIFFNCSSRHKSVFCVGATLDSEGPSSPLTSSVTVVS